MDNMWAHIEQIFFCHFPTSLKNGNSFKKKKQDQNSGLYVVNRSEIYDNKALGLKGKWIYKIVKFFV